VAPIYAHQLRLPATHEWPASVRLVVVDMDGTLLDDNNRIPEGLWPACSSPPAPPHSPAPG